MITVFARVIEGLDVVGATRVSRSNWILHEGGFIPLASELQTATRPSVANNAAKFGFFSEVWRTSWSAGPPVCFPYLGRSVFPFLVSARDFLCGCPQLSKTFPGSLFGLGSSN